MPKIIVKDHKYYFKIRGLGGVKGDTGPAGPQGPQGPQGPYVNVVTGTTTTLPAGSSAQVTVNNTGNTSTLNFGIPQGVKGDKGDAGTPGAQGPRGFAATVNVGETTTGQPGTDASVINAGDEHDAVLKFTVPRGEKGETGETGPQGPTGGVKSTVVADLPETGESDKYYLVYRDSEGGTITTTDGRAQIENSENGGDLTVSQLLGNAEQTTYSGKNLCPYMELGWLYGTDGSEQANTSAVQTIRSGFIAVEPNTTYIVSSPDYSGTWFWYEYKSDKTYNLTINKGNATGIFTTETGTQWVRIRTNTPYADLSARIQVELGSTVTVYEPYVGGIPSPNPDYPQDIQVVTGDSTVVICGKNSLSAPQDYTEDRDGLVFTCADGVYNIRGNASSGNVTADHDIVQPYTIREGDYWHLCNDFTDTHIQIALIFTDGSIRNYSPGNVVNRIESLSAYAGKTVSKIRFYYNSGYNINGNIKPMILNGVSTATDFIPYQGQSYEVNLGKNLCSSGAYLNANTISLSVQSGMIIPQTFTASFISDIAVSGVGVGLTVNGTPVATLANSFNIPANQRTTMTATIQDSVYSTLKPSDTVFVSFYKSGSGYDTSHTLGEPQIEAGNRATSYAPYFTPIELAKVGNYQDRIYKDDGKWYIEKNVGKVVLPSTVGGYNNVSNWYYMGFTNLGIGAGVQDGGVMSNYFTMDGYSHMGTYATKDGAIATSAAYIVIRNTDCTDTASYRTWLASNPTTVYYALATPTTTEITDETLLAQLNFLASLYEGVNNISLVGTGAQGELTGNYVVYDKYNRHKVYIWSSDDNTWQIILQ